jgi:hypothetical protein
MSWMASYTKPITSSGYNGLGLSPADATPATVLAVCSMSETYLPTLIER